MNIYQRINEVRKKIEYIKKDASVQGYMAVTHDAVTAILRDHLIEAGIVILPDQISGQVVEVGKTKNGTTIIRYEAVYKVVFVNADDPGDQFALQLEAHANDSGDKAPGKALSYAVKSAMLKVFSIETGVNDESRMENERSGKLVIDHLKEELQEYLDSGDSLAIALFARNIDQHLWIEISNSAPDGKKTAFKTKLRDMEAQGHEILEAINQAINSEDDLKAKENIADLTDGGKKLLARHIGKERSALLGKLVSA